MAKRIVICGPSASGKTYIRRKMERRGSKFDISYTTREKRPGEIEGEDYHFISIDEFLKRLEEGFFYEWVSYSGNFYGTGRKEWEELQYFIMEAEGVKHITEEDRKDTFIIYLNPPVEVRIERMAKERGWSDDIINKRMDQDNKKFSGFSNYDVELKEWVYPI